MGLKHEFSLRNYILLHSLVMKHFFLFSTKGNSVEFLFNISSDLLVFNFSHHCNKYLKDKNDNLQGT